MKRFLFLSPSKAAAIAAAAGLASLAPSAARATLFDGYLAECTAVAAGSCTELTGGTYARQPISFSDAVKGVSSSSIPYSFGNGAAGTVVGRALYDAATGGNLVAVIPLAAAVISPPVDQADVGAIKITVTPLVPYQSQKLYNAPVAAGSTLGTSSDGSTITAGGKDVFRAGYLTPAYPSFDASYPLAPVLTTAFSITTLTNQAHYVVNGAATLATGAIQLPSAPYDGQSFTLACNVTVTALTVTPAAGQTVSATPTSCGAAAAHEWFWAAAGSKWTMLF